MQAAVRYGRVRRHHRHRTGAVVVSGGASNLKPSSRMCVCVAPFFSSLLSHCFASSSSVFFAVSLSCYSWFSLLYSLLRFGRKQFPIVRLVLFVAALPSAHSLGISQSETLFNIRTQQTRVIKWRKLFVFFINSFNSFRNIEDGNQSIAPSAVTFLNALLLLQNFLISRT